MITAIVTFIFRHTGIVIGRRRRYRGKAAFSISGRSYGFVLPYANYAPWESDQAFQGVYRQSSGHTLVDVYRCYELWQLVEQAHFPWPAAAMLEVGVWRGGTAAIMGRQLDRLGSDAPLYLADTFTGVVKAGDEDAFYRGGEHSQTSVATVEDLLHRTSAYPNVRILEGIFPDESAAGIPDDEVVSLCHIDVDVYESARDVLEWVWPKLVPGGIVIFDDYGFHVCPGVTKLVEEHRHDVDRHIVHNLNGHALMIKLG